MSGNGRPRDRWQKVTVELSIRTTGNHRHAATAAIQRIIGLAGGGSHVDEGSYDYEIVKANRAHPGRDGAP